MKKTIKIQGMSCNHCVMAVKSALTEIPGVSKVEVELDNNRAIVEGEDLIDSVLREAIEDAGYDVAGIN